MCYPDQLIRGIPNQSFIDEDGFPSAALFYFNKPESERLPSFREESINWHDDDGAIEQAFNQRKPDGDLQFRVGVAIISRAELDRIRISQRVGNQFGYDRNAIVGNSYHGNMLLTIETPKPVMKKIAAAIALYVAKIIKREDYERQ